MSEGELLPVGRFCRFVAADVPQPNRATNIVSNHPSEPQAPAATRKSSDKYQRILDAAISVIAEKGYWQARVSEIADRAGVADGTIYLYYKSKEQLLMSAIDSAFAAFMERARHELAEVSGPSQRLHRLAFVHLDMMGSRRDLAIVFQTELRQSARFLMEFSRHRLVEYFELIRGIIREGQEQGVFRADMSDKIAANCFFGAVDEMVTSWILSDREYPLAGAADAIVGLILRGMETNPGQR
jgi:TetR/AcrR family fatty acid metabolism transcriptional regulator